MQQPQPQQSQLIYEQQPIQKISQISINALADYSNLFRLSYQQIQMNQNLKSARSQQSRIFHKDIVDLIVKIQPSKVVITKILQTVKEIIQEYFPQDNKYKLRNQAKQKLILVINKLTAEEEFQIISDVKSQIEKFRRCILARESQLGSILYLEDNRGNQSQDGLKKKYQDTFGEILSFIVPVKQCAKKINFRIISKIIHYQLTLFDDFHQKAQKLDEQLIHFQQKFSQQKLIASEHETGIHKSLKQLKILTAKLSTIVELFPFACLKPEDDLFSYDLISQRWQNLFQNDVLYYKLYGQPAIIDKSFNQLKANLNIINATMSILNQARANPNGLKYWSSQLESIKKVLKCTVSKSVAHHQAEVMISQPTETLAKEIWNLPQKKQFKSFIQLTLPSIAFSQQIFIPRKAKQFFTNTINGIKSFLPNFKIQDREKYYNEMYVAAGHEQKISLRINNSFQLDLKPFEEKIQEENTNFFKKKMTEMKKNLKNTLQTVKNTFKKKNDPPKTVIFHIHGGGFISMSSFIHQSYTRRWANSLHIPIISVDYGKAPQYPYPEGLYDCFQAYLWMLNCFEQIYEAQPLKILLVGDSAGGNLVAALTNLLIEWKLRIPDGIVLVYPALNLDYFDFTPSLLTALNDMILPHTFLKICLNSYLKDPSYKPKTDYFISPLKAPDWILKQYPPTRMFVGSKDPFHDDCCRFAQRIDSQIPKNVRLIIFQQFPHGFLQFDMNNQPHHYCQQAIKEVQNALSELMKK